MISDQQAAFESMLSTISSKATYGGASTTVIAWLLSSEFIMLMGLIIALAGFAVNWYYRRKDDKRKEVEHFKRMGHK